jgi:uncharacterized protein YndB with AHSA1/START domain
VAGFALTRVFDAPRVRVWELVGDPGSSPHPEIEVTVEQPGAPDGTGLVRVVKPGRGTFHEEITAIDPPSRLEYRLAKGAPVRDYRGTVTLDEAPGDGTRLCWEVAFRPIIPGSGWLISRASMRTINQVLDAVEERLSGPCSSDLSLRGARPSRPRGRASQGDA